MTCVLSNNPNFFVVQTAKSNRNHSLFFAHQPSQIYVSHYLLSFVFFLVCSLVSNHLFASATGGRLSDGLLLTHRTPFTFLIKKSIFCLLFYHQKIHWERPIPFAILWHRVRISVQRRSNDLAMKLEFNDSMGCGPTRMKNYCHSCDFRADGRTDGGGGHIHIVKNEGFQIILPKTYKMGVAYA